MEKGRCSRIGPSRFLLVLVRLAGIEPTTPWFVANESYAFGGLYATFIKTQIFINQQLT